VKVIFAWIKKKTQPEMNYFQLYQLYFGIMAVGTFTAPIVLGIFFGIWELRYSVFTFFLGFVNIILIAYYFLPVFINKNIRFITVTLMIIPISFIIINFNNYNPFKIIEKFSSYYPGIAKAVDTLSMKYHLKNGVAEHWNTKNITQLSRKGNKVHCIYNASIYPRHFGNNLNSFFYTDCNKKDTAFFNYIIAMGLSDTTFIYNLMGEDVKAVYVDGYKFYLVNDFYYDRNSFAPIKTNRNSFIKSGLWQM
jgi:hypothetical protein